MTPLAIKNLGLALGGEPVLRDVSLTVGAGEIVGLLGPNGAGKTTTMLAAVGLLPRTAGDIAVFGQDPWEHGTGLRRRIGVLPDPNGFYDWMTARDYLTFFAGLYDADLDAASVTRRLDAVGLSPPARQPIGAFSRGMRQRLGLARALIADPLLLVLDEPTNGLDPRGRREIHDLLAERAHAGVGVLLCTHILDDVERLCTHASFIAGGRTVAAGRIDDLVRTHAAQPRFRLELSGPVPPAAPAPADVRVIAHDQGWAVVDLDPAVTPDAAWRELLFLGWPITAIAHEGGGLEDVYLSVVQSGPPPAGAHTTNARSTAPQTGRAA